MRRSSQFLRQLNRLRKVDCAPQLTVSDQLRFLPVSPAPGVENTCSRGELPSGRVVETDHGRHYVLEEEWPDSHFHGNVRLGRLDPGELSVLLDLAGLGATDRSREGIVFLDTETTGVHGGTGMCPFLIGIGYYRRDRFEVRQYFIRNFDEEASMLEALAGFLTRFDLIVTYNGRTFDVPLVENRCVLARMDRPFGHMRHFDLLFMARRLWKASLGSCRLMALEERIVRFQRGPDIPGAKIPQAYFQYLRTGRVGVLRSVFSHNVYDILSLAALTIEAADRVCREPARLEDSRDLYSLGKLFDRGAERVRSIHYYELALGARLPDRLRLRALERLSVLYRRTGQPDQAFECCLDLMKEETFSYAGYQGAAMHHERRRRDIGAACAVLEEGARRLRGVPGMEGRAAKLESRLMRLERRRVPKQGVGLRLSARTSHQ